MMTKCLSHNGLYSLNNCPEPFSKSFQQQQDNNKTTTRQQPCGKSPFEQHLSFQGASLDWAEGLWNCTALSPTQFEVGWGNKKRSKKFYVTVVVFYVAAGEAL